MKQKPTYKKPVAACAIILFVGAITLAVLMETRQMAPPRKYEVDMSGEVIGIDHGPKTPVLTKEEVKDEEVKEERKSESTGEKKPKEEDQSSETDEPIIVPTVPGDRPDATPSVKVPKPEIKKPMVESIEN